MFHIKYLTISLFLSFIFISLPVFAVYEDWNYNIPITINNTQNSDTLIDYQVFMNISYISGTKTDFSDLRFSFYNSSGEFEIQYWIENQKNGSYAEIWIKIPEITANEYEIVYMYYGNFLANSSSNSNKTMILYDDFDIYSSTTDATFLEKYNIFTSGGYVRLVDDGNGGKEVEAVNSGAGGWQGGTMQTKDRYQCVQAKFDYKIKPRTFRDISFHYGFTDREGYDFWNGKNYSWFGQWLYSDFNSSMEVFNDKNKSSIIVNDINTTFGKRQMRIGWCYPYSVIYIDNKFNNKIENATATPKKQLQFSYGMQAGATYNSYAYLDNLRIAKFSYPEPNYIINYTDTNYINKTNITLSVPEFLEADSNFNIYASVDGIKNLTKNDFVLKIDGYEKDFDFLNNNGNYSFLVNSGKTIGKLPIKLECKESSAETFLTVVITPQNNIVFFANSWEDVFKAGFIESVFRRFSGTEIKFLEGHNPNQIFLLGSSFENVTGDNVYKIKDESAFLDTFYSKENAIFVADREQALLLAEYAKIRNYPLLINPDKNTADRFLNIENFSDYSDEQIKNLVINEALSKGKTINTIAVANPDSKSSALLSSFLRQHDSFVITTKHNITYPDYVNDFISANTENGVLALSEKINQAVEFLNSKGIFANYFEYKINNMQLNLAIFGDMHEIPHAMVFDPGMEKYYDEDSNYLLTDLVYSNVNKDGNADLMTGRIISEYQLFAGNNKKIVSAALYRNPEIIFSGNGLAESQTTDSVFRGKGFEAERFVENRTNLSEYKISVTIDSVADFIREILDAEFIFSSLRIMEKIYENYQEYLEHNNYKMMNSINFWNGIELTMVPDRSLAKQEFINEMSGSAGIFYYGLGNETCWFLDSYGKEIINFEEFPLIFSSFVYNEYTNSMRYPIRFFEKGASAVFGPSGIVYDTLSFSQNSKIVNSIANNNTVSSAIERGRYSLGRYDAENLTKILSFGAIDRDVRIKQFLEPVFYGDPEFKIDPADTESVYSPEINFSGNMEAVIRIPADYKVIDNAILFNASFHLIEINRPFIPVYTKEFFIPNNSEIIGMSGYYNSTIYDNITFEFFIDKHFDAGSYSGFYPDNIYWFDVFDMLDGRKKIVVNAVGALYENETKTAIVFDEFLFTFTYSSPYEFIGVSSENIALGETQKFAVKTYSIDETESKAYIKIKSSGYGEILEKDFLADGLSETLIEWKPVFAGAYEAEVYVMFGNNSAGPRYTNFYVYPEFNFTEKNESTTGEFFYKAFSGMDGVIKSEYGIGKAGVSFSNRDLKFEIHAQGEKSAFTLSKREYTFIVSQKPGFLSYTMKTKEGEYVYEKSAGSEREVCRGSCDSAKELLPSAFSEVSFLSEYVLSVVNV